MAPKSNVSNAIRQKALAFLKDPQDVCVLNEIVKSFSDGQNVSPCLLALQMIFTKLFEENKMSLKVDTVKNPDAMPDMVSYYRHFFKETMKVVVNNKDERIRVQAFGVLMKLIEFEGKYYGEKASFPQNKFKAVLALILSKISDTSPLINKFSEYLEFDDVLFNTWITLNSVILKVSVKETYVVNFFNLLDKLAVKGHEEPTFLCQSVEFDQTVIKKHINRFWPFVMNWEHTVITQHKLLKLLLDKILLHLQSPLLLTDFVMDSLNIGGPTSILALEAIYKLMQIEHINYPGIFTTLYGMLEPPVFHTRYKARLLFLTDLFLRSTHISEQLVAGFVKRLARLTLVVPSEDTIIIMKLIQNLVLRHPGLSVLLSRNILNCNKDPFNMEEQDPSNSYAMASFLWEIESLKSHQNPVIAKFAATFHVLPKMEWDIGVLLDTISDDVFDKIIRKRSKVLAIQFEKLYQNNGQESTFQSFWKLP